MTGGIAILVFFAFICFLMVAYTAFNQWVQAKKYLKSLEMSYAYSDKLLALLREYTTEPKRTAFVTGLTVESDVGETEVAVTEVAEAKTLTT